MLVKELSNQQFTADGGTTPVSFEMPKGTRGIVTCETSGYSGTGTIDVKLQGRLSPDIDFVDVADGASDVGSTTERFVIENLQGYPEMRIFITMNSVTAVTVKTYFSI